MSEVKYYTRTEDSEVVSVITVVRAEEPNSYTEIVYAEYNDGSQSRSQFVSKKLNGPVIEQVQRTMRPSNRELFLLIARKATGHVATFNISHLENAEL